MKHRIDSSPTLAGKWKSGYGLQVDGITFGGGKITLCDCVKTKRDGRSFPSASPTGDSTLDSVLNYNGDPWVALTELDRVEVPGRNLKLSCGEGAMGNEGYVAVTAMDTGIPIWIAFFTCSNPFDSLRLDNDEIVVENSYEQEWIFPLENPERFRISQP